MKTLLGGIAMLTMVSTGALAQSNYTTTTTQATVPATGVPPAGYGQPLPPPVGTLSTTRESHAVDAYGNQSSSRSTTYRDATGVERQSSETTVAAPPPPPPPPPVSTTTTTTESTTTGPQ